MWFLTKPAFSCVQVYQGVPINCHKQYFLIYNFLYFLTKPPFPVFNYIRVSQWMGTINTPDILSLSLLWFLTKLLFPVLKYIRVSQRMGTINNPWHILYFASVILDQACIFLRSSISGSPIEWAQAITPDLHFPSLIDQASLSSIQVHQGVLMNVQSSILWFCDSWPSLYYAVFKYIRLSQGMCTSKNPCSTLSFASVILDQTYASSAQLHQGVPMNGHK